MKMVAAEKKLGRIVEEAGLAEVVETISAVCSAKATNSLYNLHDPILCTEWEKAAKILRKAYTALRKLKLQ
jgi:hypothetical protein